MLPNLSDTFHATTIIAIRRKNGRKNTLALAADGQVTFANTVMKNKANKVRKLYRGSILSGFAGSVADAVTLYEKMEKKLEECTGDLVRASVELAREWRSDKYLRRLEAMLIVADAKKSLLLSGTGEVIEPEDPVLAIGSGGEFARSAALALLENTSLPPAEIATKALAIAAKICIYTNSHLTLETLSN